jgi:glutamyl-tRNA synthetase
MLIKTRFAPSPTGYLHLGNARTALYSWLYAKKNSGKFFLRIEDTDPIRSKKAYYDNIIESLSLLGINWDSEPLVQSQRDDIYKKIINQLLENKMAYKCYCSRERLDRLKEEQKKKEG